MSSIFKLLFAQSEEDRNPLTFTAEQARSTVILNKTGQPNVDGIQYKTTGGWQPYTIGETITLTNIGDTVQFQDLNPGTYSSSDYRQFKMTGKIAASGNIQSMMNYSDECTSYCYYYMFNGCSSLTSAPELPATILALNCYAYMFNFCSSLTSTPELPATTLADYCYYNMFNACSNITTAPELPATTLATRCYASMFQKCSKLTSAPELLATNLVSYCYFYMFNGCSSLNYIKVGFKSWPIETYISNWVNGVSSTGTFEAPEELPVQFGVSRIPVGWSVPNGKYIIASNQSFSGKDNEEVEFYIDYQIYPESLQPTFTIIEGSLPAGLSLDSTTGLITGTPEEAFTGDLTVRISAEGCADVDIEISILIEWGTGIDPTGLFLYHPLTETLSVLPTGQSVQEAGAIEYTIYNRITNGIFLAE